MATIICCLNEREVKMKPKELFLIIGILVLTLACLVRVDMEGKIIFASLLIVEKNEFDQIVFYYRIEKDRYQRLYTKKHSIDKFSKLKIGMEFYEVDDLYKLLGKPTGAKGNAIGWTYYKLDNGWYIYYRASSRAEEGVCDIRIVDHFSKTQCDTCIGGYFFSKYREFELEQVEIEKDVYQKLGTKPKYSLAKFSKLEIGMTPDEVSKLVGKPTDTEGSDIVWFRYKIGKGWFIDLQFFSEGLNDMRIVDYRNNRIFKLKQNDFWPAYCEGRQ
jgi:hypothetical protein